MYHSTNVNSDMKKKAKYCPLTAAIQFSFLLFLLISTEYN